jgi:hypothetical protein
METNDTSITEFFGKKLRTFDNQDPENPGGKWKKFPLQKPHIKWYLEKLQQYRRNNIWVYKSRDLVTTKTNQGWMLYNLQFSEGMEMAIHRKTDTDTQQLIGEIYEMYMHLPDEYMEDLPKLLYSTKKALDAQNRDGHGAGYIKGVSATPSALQGWNCNIYFWDEFEEDIDPDKVMHATVGSGRKMLQVIGVSNPNGKATKMYRYILGEGTEELKTPKYNDDNGFLISPNSPEAREKFWLKEELPGCWCGFNNNNDVVIMMHFTADPDKRFDSELRWRDDVTGEMLNWYEKYFLNAPRNIRARQYNLSFEVVAEASVFPTFNKEFHGAAEIMPLSDRTVHIGMDLGEQNGAAVLFQITDDKRLIILHEIVPPHDSFGSFMGAVTGVLAERFGGLPRIVHPDPTGGYQTGADYFRLLRDIYQMEIHPPPEIKDSRFRMRVVQHLLETVHKGKPRLEVDVLHCPKLIDGFTHGYRMATNKFGYVQDKPNKDGYYDHLFDALTYGILCTSQEIESVVGLQTPQGFPLDPYVEEKQKTLAEIKQQTRGGRYTYAD